MPHPDPAAPLFHITTRAAAEAARLCGAYRDASLAREGYIHLSQAHQVAAVARSFYAGQPGLVLLVIDPALLTAPLKYEPPGALPAPAGLRPEAAALFPHLYGALDAQAIVGVLELADFIARQDGD